MIFSSLDVSMMNKFIQACPVLTRLNLEHNPLLYDTVSFDTSHFSASTSILLLPHLSNGSSSESIQSYLNFLTNISSMFIQLRQTIEQYQTEPFDLLKSIHHHCQQYSEAKKVELMPISTPVIVPTNKGKS